MGAAYFIVLNVEKPGFDTFVNGKSLAKASKAFEKMTAKLSIESLNDFVSVDSEALSEMAEDIGDELDTSQSAARWFSADTGLNWIAKVKAHLHENPKAIPNADGVLADLNEYEQVLLQAKNINALWHLAIDF